MAYEAEYLSMITASHTCGEDPDATTMVNDAGDCEMWAPAVWPNEDGPNGTPRGKSNDGSFSDAEWKRVTRVVVNFGKAIAAYERTMVSGNAAFDKWAAGNHDAMSNDAKKGLKLFIGKAKCLNCHNGPTFQNRSFHNVGVSQGYENNGVHHDNTTDQGLWRKIGKVVGVGKGGWSQNSYYSDDACCQAEMTLGDDDARPGTANGIADTCSESCQGWTHLKWFHNMLAQGGCRGAYGCTEGAGASDGVKNLGMWRTLGLRSLAGTAPFFHNGSSKTLRDVVEHYNNPPTANGNGHSGALDANMAEPLGLTDAEVDQVVAFMEALQGEPLEYFSPPGVEPMMFNEDGSIKYRNWRPDAASPLDISGENECDMPPGFGVPAGCE